MQAEESARQRGAALGVELSGLTGQWAGKAPNVTGWRAGVPTSHRADSVFRQDRRGWTGALTPGCTAGWQQHAVASPARQHPATPSGLDNSHLRSLHARPGPAGCRELQGPLGRGEAGASGWVPTLTPSSVLEQQLSLQLAVPVGRAECPQGCWRPVSSTLVAG